MQETAEATLLQALKDAPQGSQGLIVAVDLPSGAVVAMAQTSKGQAAEALSTPREAGRLLRPVILAAAFERGISPLTAYTTDAGQMILYQGATTADADTYDRVARQVGREAVLDTARLLGLGAALQADGSDYGDDLASLRVTPLQVATLFTALATEGRAPVSVSPRPPPAALLCAPSYRLNLLTVLSWITATSLGAMRFPQTLAS